MPIYRQLFTHDDLDGVGCGVIFKARFGLDSQVAYCNYRNFNTRIAEYLENMKNRNRVGSLMVTDAAITPDTAILIDEYVARGGQALLLDHHANGEAYEGQPYLTWMNAKPWAHVDANRCGTKLAYDYLQPDAAYAPLVDLIQNYDVSGWVPEYPGHHASPSPQAKELNQLRYLVGKEPFVARFASDPSIEFREGERLVLDLDHQALDRYRKEVASSALVLQPNVLGQRFAVAFCDRYTSDIAHMLMDDLKLDAIILIDLHHHKISLRSHEGVNVGRVAAYLGGGGHGSAAGVSLDTPGLAPLFMALNAFTLNLGTTIASLTATLTLPAPVLEVEDPSLDEPAV